jgi:hypothetical protein
MKYSQLLQIIKEEIKKVLNESISVDSSGNLIGLDNPPDKKKVKDSIEKIISFIESIINLNPDKLEPMEEPRHEWKVMDLDLEDISDVIIMHGNDVFKLPPSEYNQMTLRIIDEYKDVNILLWTPNQSIPVLDPNKIGDTYNKGIISFKYKGKLIGNNFSRDINYEYGKDKKYKI